MFTTNLVLLSIEVSKFVAADDGGIENLGARWKDFPFKQFFFQIIGWSFVALIITGIALSILGALLGGAFLLAGKKSGKLWLAFFLGLVLMAIGGGGTALLFALSGSLVIG